MKTTLNSFCTVTLTEEGVHILRQHHERTMSMMPDRYVTQFPDGISPGTEYRAQLWKLMEVFGPYLFMGCRQPFDVIIDIEEKENAD